ncbi:MAG: SDR family NAD(P)-dependent oxidoreductase [Treponema sp.]
MRRIAIITGASSGFGAEFALQYARDYAAKQGCTELWLMARDSGRLHTVQTTIECKNFLTIRCFAYDIAGEAGLRHFQQLLMEEKQYGDFSIILLINNAGFGIYGSFYDTEPVQLLDMINLNVYTATGCCSAVLPFMQRGACIVNTVSMAAFLPVGKFCVYAATKAYLLSFSISLRTELQEHGITVLAFCPGQAQTGFAARAVSSSDAYMQGAKKTAPLVHHCLRCLEKKRAYALYGIQWKLQAFFSRFIGKRFFAWFTFHFIMRIKNRQA